MNGYVQNKTSEWRHVMKRSVGPNQKISLDELYEQYGYKHSLEEGIDFINWLRTVKLRDTNLWRIVVDDAVENTQVITDDTTKTNGKLNRQTDNVPPMVKQTFTVEDVVDLSVRKAKDKLPFIMDAKLLKYALKEAECRSGKDSLCRLLRKRIQELDMI